MNDVVIVTTAGGRVVLRGHRRSDPARVVFEHQVMGHARSHGIPVPEPIRTPDGAVIVERSGRLYSLFAHASGHQVFRHDLDVALAAAMGAMLGHVHAALVGLGSGAAPRPGHLDSTANVLARIERLRERIAAVSEPGDQEEWAIERLRTRAEWLRTHPDPPAPSGEAEQVIHGDYQA